MNGLTHAQYVARQGGITSTLKTTPEAAAELRTRGYSVTTDVLYKLVTIGEVSKSTQENNRVPSWTPERIDEAAVLLERDGSYTPLCDFLRQHYGLTMSDHHAALLAAHDALIDQHGAAALRVLGSTIDASKYVMSITPQYGDRPARISFSLLPEICEEIEKQKPTSKIKRVSK